ncbi:MAG: hypothetical protein Hens2KO_09680 [Henriciella sp.]
MSHAKDSRHPLLAAIVRDANSIKTYLRQANTKKCEPLCRLRRLRYKQSGLDLEKMTFDPSTLTDEALSALLLDFVHGRVTAAQSEAIAAAISNDPKLAEEVEYYRGLSNAVLPTRQAAKQDELGWTRLSSAIAAETNSENGQSPAANDNQPFWKYAAAALAVVAALQTTFLLQGNSSPEDQSYVTASAEDTEAFALDIVFKSGATLDEVTQTLKSVDAEVFYGPSALGLYGIRFDTEEARDVALQTLNSDDNIVETVSLR